MTDASPATARPPALGSLTFSFLSILVGIVAGLGAVVFRAMIALFHNLLFLGQLSSVYDTNSHTSASPWGPGIILVPVVGAAIVSFLVKNFAPEAKGHGVPEVMDAIYYNRGRIRPVVAAIKSVASAISIGSGGSVGREGPIIQIGSSFGSTLGQLIRMPHWQRIVLIAGGAGGGIAATFNTPVGGILFAIEIMMNEISVRTLVPVAISTATAAYIGRLVFGPSPSFIIPRFETPFFHVTEPLVLLSYVGLGLLMGLVSALFIKSIYGFEDFFEQRIGGSYYRRHLLGMLLVGLMIFAMFSLTGHYYIQGVGYATIQDVLSGVRISVGLLILLAALKLVATSLTLGSGASGGIFSPALFLGATVGGAYGLLLDQIFPAISVSAPAFAVAGMAGAVGGATGAAVAAIVMIFEMTLDYNVIIPMTITVAIAYGIRKVLCEESIYTLKNVRRGHPMPQALHTNLHFMRRASRIMEPNFDRIDVKTTLGEFARLVAHEAELSLYLVVDQGGIFGVVPREAAIEALNRAGEHLTLRDIAHTDYVVVDENCRLHRLLSDMRISNASIALVKRPGSPDRAESIVGLITKTQISDVVAESVALIAV
jgi:CIC family chloride channel protein